MNNFLRKIKSRKGFTLIELMVTIAIIGLIAGIVVVSMGEVRERAKDTRRKSDLDQLQKALEIYYAEKDQYPTTGGNWTILNGIDDPLTSKLVPKYIGMMPQDPKGTNQLPFVYKYASDGSHFALDCAIENSGDKDAHIIGVWEAYDVLIYRLLSAG